MKDASRQPAAPKNAPQVGMDQQSGRLTLDGQVLDRNDPRLWGTSGAEFTNREHLSGSAGHDPRYWEVDPDRAEDDAGTQMYRLRADVAQRLGGRMQLGQSGVGGEGEIINPSDVTYDPEFGVLTSGGNVRPRENAATDWRNLIAMMAAGGAGAGAIAAAEAGAGLGAGMGAAPPAVGSGAVDAATGYGLGGSAGEAAATGGMGSPSMWQTLSQYLPQTQSGRGQMARGLLSLMNGGGGGGSQAPSAVPRPTNGRAPIVSRPGTPKAQLMAQLLRGQQ